VLMYLTPTVGRRAQRGADVAVVGLAPRRDELCAALWPEPRPLPASSLAAAIAPVRALPGVPA
jgi:hypothetical protein